MAASRASWCSAARTTSPTATVAPRRCPIFRADLLDAVQAVAAVGSDQPRGNLVETGAPGVKPAPLTVPMDAEAMAIFDALDDEMTRRQRAAIGTDQSAALARVWENAAKVALIKAVSANPAGPVIRGVDAQWAREVVEHCVATLLIQAERHLADNEIERCHKRILELVRAAGRGGIRQNDLTTQAAVHRAKAPARAPRDLVESEQIVPVRAALAAGRRQSTGSQVTS